MITSKHLFAINSDADIPTLQLLVASLIEGRRHACPCTFVYFYMLYTCSMHHLCSKTTIKKNIYYMEFENDEQRERERERERERNI